MRLNNYTQRGQIDLAILIFCVATFFIFIYFFICLCLPNEPAKTETKIQPQQTSSQSQINNNNQKTVVVVQPTPVTVIQPQQQADPSQTVWLGVGFLVGVLVVGTVLITVWARVSSFKTGDTGSSFGGQKRLR